MNNIHILAHTWKGTDLTIQVFHSVEKTNKYLSELIGHQYVNSPDDSPHDIIEKYHSATEHNEEFHVGYLFYSNQNK